MSVQNERDELELETLTPEQGFDLSGIGDGDRFGVSAAGGGDFNADGVPDLVVGAPRGRGPSTVYLFFGDDGSGEAYASTGALDGSNGFVIKSIADGDELGLSVDFAGDVNGDGIDDIVIGAPDARSRSGEAYVVFGSADAFTADLDLDALDGSNGFAIPGVGGGLGSAVSGAGDVNNDGIDDLIVGAPGLIVEGTTGSAYVIYGRDSAFDPVFSIEDLDSANGNDGSLGFVIPASRIPAVNDVGRVGASVDGGGDVNGDGIDDIIVGAPRTSINGSGTGGAYVVYGTDGSTRTRVDLRDLDGTDGFAILGVLPTNSFVSNEIGDNAGSGVAIVGDMNGDGLDDVAVGAEGGSTQAFSTGALNVSGTVHVVFGDEAPSASIDLDEIGPSSGFLITGALNGDRLGNTVSAAGDVDGDGLDDLLIAGPPRDSVNAADRDQAYLIFGAATPPTEGYDVKALDGVDGVRLTVNEPLAPNELGSGLTGLGDVNADGIGDFFVAAPAEVSVSPSYPGTGWIIFGAPKPTELSAPSDADDAANQVVESAVAGTTVGITLDAVASNGGAVSFELDDDRFAVNASKQIVVADPARLNGRVEDTVTVSAKSISGGQVSAAAAFTIDLLSPLEALEDADAAAGNGVPRQALAGTYTGVTLVALDPDAADTVTYEILEGPFAIDASDGTQRVVLSGDIDFDGAPIDALTLRARATTDGNPAGGSLSQELTLPIALLGPGPLGDIVDLDGPDADPSLNDGFFSDAAVDTRIGLRLFASDPDGSPVGFELTDPRFKLLPVEPNTFDVVIAQTGVFNPATEPVITLDVTGRAQDASEGRASFEIPVLAPDRPLLALIDNDPSDNKVAENAPIGTPVGVVARAIELDLDQVPDITYELTGDDRFGLVETIPGLREVQVIGPIDFEAGASATFDITATSGSSSLTESFTVEILDVNEPPTPIEVFGLTELTISEAAPAGLELFTFRVGDPDAGDGVVVDTTFGAFTVENLEPDFYRAFVGLEGVLDFETQPVLTFDIVATSLSDPTAEQRQPVTITLTDAPEPISEILFFSDSGFLSATPTPNAVRENRDGVLVERMAVFEPDAGDLVTWSVSDEAFEIVVETDAPPGQSVVQLRVKEGVTLNFEQAAIRSVEVAARSSGGAEVRSATIDVEVLDQDESLTVIDLDPAPNEVPENEAGAYTGVTLRLRDPDVDPSEITFSVPGLPRFDFVPLDSPGVFEVRTLGPFDFEGPLDPSFTVIARSGDGSVGNFTSERFELTVLDRDDPTFVLERDLSTPNEIPENAPAGTYTGVSIEVLDQDLDPSEIDVRVLGLPGVALTPTDDPGLYEVRTTREFSFETGPVFSFTVRAQDGDNPPVDEIFTVDVLDRPEPLNELRFLVVVDEFDSFFTTTPPPLSIVENPQTRADRLVAQIEAFDPDAGDEIIWELSSELFEVRLDSDSRLFEVLYKQDLALDFETTPSLTLDLTARSTGGPETRSVSLDIAVIDVDEPRGPLIDTDPAPNFVLEGSTSDYVGLTVDAIDPDANPAFQSPSFFASSGNGLFQFDAGAGDQRLFVSGFGVFDAENEPLITIEVRTDSDESGDFLPANQSFQIFVGADPDPNGPLFDFEPGPNRVPEDAEAGFLIDEFEINLRDLPRERRFLLSIDDDRFEIGGDPRLDRPTLFGQLLVAEDARFDYETEPFINLTVTYTEDRFLEPDLVVSETFLIEIEDVDEPLGPIEVTKIADPFLSSTGSGGRFTGFVLEAEDPEGAPVAYEATTPGFVILETVNGPGLFIKNNAVLPPTLDGIVQVDVQASVAGAADAPQTATVRVPVRPDLAALDGSTGFKITNLFDASSAGFSTQLGFSVAGVFDLNQDGFDDVLIGAPFSDRNGTDAGAAFVLFGSADGFGGAIDVSELTGDNGFALYGAAAGDQAGYAVSAAGNFNRSGPRDILIGAPGAESTPGLETGRGYVVYGRTDAYPAEIELGALTAETGVVINGAPDAGRAGASVSPGLKGGILLGAPAGAGAAYAVFSSQDPGATIELSALDGETGVKFVANGDVAELGFDVGGGLDIDGAEGSDIVISARGETAAYVVFGDQEFDGVYTLPASGSDGVLAIAAAPDIAGLSNFNIGVGASVLQDFVPDVILGEQIVDLTARRALPEEAAPSGFILADEEGLGGGRRANYSAGFTNLSSFALAPERVDAAAVGDVNDDKIGDILFGAVNTPAVGDVTLIYGLDDFGFGQLLDASGPPISDFDQEELSRLRGADFAERFGYSVAGAGDFNGDGVDDVIIGAPGAEGGLGAAYLLYGVTNPQPVGPLSDRDARDNAYFVNNPSQNGVGVRLFAEDPNGRDQVTYSLSGDPRLDVSGSGGVFVRFGSEFAPGETTVGFTGVATSSDGSSVSETFEVALVRQTLAFSIDDADIQEGRTITATLSRASTEFLSVPLFTDAPDDIEIPLAAIFEEGVTEVEIPITAKIDGALEGPEAYTIRSLRENYSTALLSGEITDGVFLGDSDPAPNRIFVNNPSSRDLGLSVSVTGLAPGDGGVLEFEDEDRLSIDPATGAVSLAPEVAGADFAPGLLEVEATLRALGSITARRLFDVEVIDQRLSLELSGDAALEGSFLSGVVRRDRAEEDVTIAVDVDDGSELAALQPSVFLAAGVTEAAVTFAALEDGAIDGLQTAIVQLSAPDYRASDPLAVTVINATQPTSGPDLFVAEAVESSFDLGAGGADDVVVPPTGSGRVTLTEFDFDDIISLPGLTRPAEARGISRGSVVLEVDAVGDESPDTTLIFEGGRFDDLSIPFDLDSFDFAFDPEIGVSTIRLAQPSGPQPVFALRDGVDGFNGVFGGGLDDAQSLALPLFETLEAGGVEAVVWFDDLKGKQAVASADASFFGSSGHITLRAVGDDLELRLQEGSGREGQSFTIRAANVLEEDRPIHLFASFGPDGLGLFVNGAQVGSNAFTGGTAGNAEPVVLGASAERSSEGAADKLRAPFDGLIERFALYDEQPDADAIAALSASALSVETPVADLLLEGLVFSGDAADAVIQADDAIFDAPDGAVEFFFSTDTVSGVKGLGGRDARGNADGHLNVRLIGDDIELRLQTATDTERFLFKNAVEVGLEHHLLVNYGTEGVAVFVDGQLEVEDEGVTIDLSGNDEDFVLGANPWASAPGTNAPLQSAFSGEIGRFAVYDERFNEAEALFQYELLIEN